MTIKIINYLPKKIDDMRHKAGNTDEKIEPTLVVKTIKISAKIANRIFSITIISKVCLVHVKFFTTDKTSFNFFF